MTSAALQPLRAQLADPGVAVRLAQLLRGALHDERMVKKRRRLGTAEQARQLNLPARGFQQVVATDDERHALQPVVDRDGELVGPVPVAIARQQIAALLGGPLLLRPVTPVVESLDRRLEADANAQARRFGKPSARARPRISELGRDGLKAVP